MDYSQEVQTRFPCPVGHTEINADTPQGIEVIDRCSGLPATFLSLTFATLQGVRYGEFKRGNLEFSTPACWYCVPQ